MKKKIGLVAVALLVISMFAAGAFAMGFSKGHGMFFGNKEVKSAIESGDYNAYALAVDSEIKSRQLTQEQFNELSERYRMHAAIIEARENAWQAIEGNDYDAWSESMNDIIEIQKTRITKYNFDKMVELHKEMRNNNSTSVHHGMRFGMGIWR